MLGKPENNANLVKELPDRFKLINHESIKSFLRLNVQRINDMIQLNQPAYIDRMAKWFQLTDSKLFQTPRDSSLPLLEATPEDKLCNQSAYQELTGSLNYLAITSRSDVAFVVSRLCQFNQKPTFTHLNAAKRVLRYVIHTRHFFLKYDGDK